MIAVLDANVLYPFHLRNLLLHLATVGLFEPVWSEEIMSEARRSLRARNVMSQDAWARLDDRLRSAFGSAWFDGYQHLVDDLELLLIGAWGILAWRGALGALGFARGLAIVYGALAVLGLIPATQTLFGLAPIHGNDVWLHAVTAAALAAWFGWGAPSRGEARPEVPTA